MRSTLRNVIQIFLTITIIFGAIPMAPTTSHAQTCTSLLPSVDLTTVPENPEEPGWITLDARQSFDPDGYIAEYRWYYDVYDDFDWYTTSPDATTGLATHDHYYDATGRYEAGLIVEDNSGCTNRTTYTLLVGNECEDEYDNDGDGDIDMDDSGCTSPSDDSENSPPSASSDSYEVLTNRTLSVTDESNGVLANDSDPDGDSISVTGVTSGPSNGTVSMSSDGTFEYEPDTDYDGDDSFTYRISDGYGGSDTATVSITVIDENEAPTASNDTYSMQEDGTLEVDPAGVLSNDSDPNGDDLTADSVQSGPGNGSVDLNEDGSFSYAPNDDYNGTDSFTYQVSDPLGATDTASVEINISAVNDAPVASNDDYSTEENTPLSVENPGVLENDGDVDGDDLSASLVSGTADGSVQLTQNGSFEYTPNEGFSGTDSFEYQASDSNGGSDTAIAEITVNDAAVCNDGIDNDGDGDIDMDDPGCNSQSDSSENEAPTITLDGSDPKSINLNETYEEPGYTASDSEDGNLDDEVTTSDNIDNSSTGTYEVTYTVTDSDGVTTEETRTVEVVSSDTRDTTTYDGADGGSTANDSTCDPSQLPDGQVSYITDDDNICLYQESDIKVEPTTLSGGNVHVLFLTEDQETVKSPPGMLFRNKGGGIRNPINDKFYDISSLRDTAGESYTISGASTGEVVFGQMSEETSNDDEGQEADWIWFTGDRRNKIYYDNNQSYNNCTQPRGSGPEEYCGDMSDGDVKQINAVEVEEIEPDVYELKFVGRAGTNFNVFNFRVRMLADPWEAAIIQSDCSSSGSGYTCNFEAQEAPGTTYTWDFGDGTTETVEDDPTITYTYESSTEQYTVTLTVESNEVIREDSTTIGGEDRGDNEATGSGSICGSAPEATDATFPNPLGNDITGVCGFLAALFDAVIAIAVPIIVLMILYSGFLFVTARGDENQLQQAKSTFFWAIIGGAVLLGAEVLATVIVETLRGF